MPYQMVKQGNQYCIQKEDGSIVEGSCHTDNAMTGAMMDKLTQAMKTENKAAPKFAVDATDSHPDKLPLGDKGQIEGAITSVVTGSYRGNPITPALTADEKRTAKSRIRAAISASGEADDWKKQELARLDGKELATATKDMGMLAMMQQCMTDCAECAKVCTDTVAYCTSKGGDHAAPDHLALLSDCAAACQICCDLIAHGSDLCMAQCRICAVLCEKCAEMCDALDRADPTLALCANTCRRCEDSCEQVSYPTTMGMMEAPQSAGGVIKPGGSVLISDTKPETFNTKESPIIAWLKQTFGKKQDEPLTGSGFKALPDNHWVSYYTNNFEDKTGQIFSEKAHDQYIEWLDKGQIPYPDLWYWHIPGTKHGQAEWIDRVGHVMVAVGSFDDTPMAQLFRKEYEKAAYTTSHTFGYPKQALQGGVYHAYFTVEISPLPAGKEANPFTTFTEVKEMAISQEKHGALIRILGKELAGTVLDNGAKLSADLEERGFNFKEAATIPAVDEDAREALKSLASANKEKTDGLTNQVTQLTAAVEKLIALNTKQAEQINDLTTGVKEMFNLQPRASTSQHTVVDKTNPLAAFLADKQAGPDGPKPEASIGDQIAAIVLPAAKPQA